MTEPNPRPTAETTVASAQSEIADLLRSGHPRQGGPDAEQAKQRLYEVAVNHDTAMSTTADAIAEIVAGSNTLSAEPLMGGDEFKFITHNGQPDRDLPVTELGLPELPTDTTALSLLITQTTSNLSGRNWMTISAIGMGPVRTDGQIDKKVLFLQNPTAAVGAESKPVWVLGGSRQLGGDSREVQLSYVPGSSEDPHRPGHINLSAGEIGYLDTGQEAVTTLIRPQPNKLEEKPTEIQNKRAHAKQRVWRKIGVAAAGLISVLPTVAQHESIPIRSADEMFDLSVDYDRGIDYQAESLLDTDTSESMRATFDAFFAGDTSALSQIAENAGYQPDWLDTKVFDAVTNATDNNQLTTAFRQAIDDLPLTLNLPSRPGSDSEGTYTYGVPNLDQNKKAVAQLLESLNSFDRDLLKSVGPLVITFGTNLKAPDDSGHDKDIGGYYKEEFQDESAEIVLDVENNVISNIFDHEFGHHFDALLRLQMRLTNLNPVSHQYVGDAYEQSSTHIGSNKVVADVYGNKDAGEDTAVSFDTILSTDKKLEFTQSSLNEKQIFLLGTMEEEYPGFLASFLQNIAVPREKSFSVSSVRNEAARKQAPLTGLGLVLIVLALNKELQKARTNQQRRQYGLANIQQ